MKIRVLLILLTVVLYTGFIIPQDMSMGRTRRVVQESSLYRVYKIDSIHGYYLIYAKRKDTLYKIVSDKVSSGDCKSVKVNQEYAFKLQSLLSNNRHLPNIKLTLEATLRVNGLYYDDSTIVRLERDSINDLHSVENVRGLCFLRDCKP